MILLFIKIIKMENNFVLHACVCARNYSVAVDRKSRKWPSVLIIGLPDGFLGAKFY